MARDNTDKYVIANNLISRPQGATIDELVAALDISERAVFSMLNRLEELGFTLYSDRDPDNPKKFRYRANSELPLRLPELKFSDEEKATYNFLLDSTDNIPGLQFQLKTLFNKLKLMAAERGQLLELSEKKKASITSINRVPKLIDSNKIKDITSELILAINSNKWVKLEYESLDYGNIYSIDYYPVVLFIEEDDYYLAAINKKMELRILAIERIASIISLFDDAIPNIDNDEIKRLLNDPFGPFAHRDEYIEAKLLIDDNQAYYIASKAWPESISFEETPEGLIMNIQTKAEFQFKRWILMNTPHIKVLEPQWLKDEILEALKKAIALY